MEKQYTVASIEPRIENFLGPVLRLTGFDLTFDVLVGQHTQADVEDPDIVVKFAGPDVDLLLENRAELLLALELLSMEALRMPAEHHSRMRFDANDYRALRIEELRLSALTAAENVKKTRRPFHFNPMNSRERRVIHLSLRNETDVRSQSTGSGPVRQVVIVPAEMETIPEPVIPPRPPPSRESRGDSRGPRRDDRGGPRGDRRGPGPGGHGPGGRDRNRDRDRRRP